MATYAAKTEVGSEKSRTEIERTLTRYGHLVRFHPHGCWEWIGSIGASGYGVASMGRADSVPAHRLFYEVFRGPVPEGLDLDHLCRNRPCVNPAHLEPVSRRENLLRGHHPKVLAHHAGTCVRGHLMDAANTYLSPKGQRHCQECRRMREREREARRRTSM